MGKHRDRLHAQHQELVLKMFRSPKDFSEEDARVLEKVRDELDRLDAEEIRDAAVDLFGALAKSKRR